MRNVNGWHDQQVGRASTTTHVPYARKKQQMQPRMAGSKPCFGVARYTRKCLEIAAYVFVDASRSYKHFNAGCCRQCRAAFKLVLAVTAFAEYCKRWAQTWNR